MPDRITPLREFVTAMTALVSSTIDERRLLAKGRQHLARLIASDRWLPEAFATPRADRYAQYLLHCDPLQRFSVVSFVWGPGQRTPVHNHTVWGLVGVLRELHDELDTAVLAAYGWSDQPATDELLSRLVALNAQRAAEEKAGHVRWLRPEFQHPAINQTLSNQELVSQSQQALQADLALETPAELVAEAAAPVAATTALPWPATLPEQVRAVAQVLTSAPPEILGPLVAMRDHAVQALNQSDTPPGAAETHPSWHTHAFEIMALCHAGAYAGGDTLRFIDQKLLAILSIGEATPIIDADDAEELEQLPSLLDAIVEVLPCPKPPGGYGPLLELIGPAEIGALVPWAKPGEPYDGAVFLIKPDRLLQLVRGLDGQKLSQRLEKFCRALYGAAHGTPPDEQTYIAWRRGWEERSRPDIERLLTAWAELRLVLEMASVNQMQVGLIVYG